VVWRGDEDGLELSDRTGIVAGFGEKSSERYARLRLTLVYTEAGAVRCDRLVRIAERRIEIANSLQNVGVARLALPQSEENLLRSRMVERCDTRLRGQQEQIDVRAARRDASPTPRARCTSSPASSQGRASEPGTRRPSQ
jgi:hypothetical protein